MIFYKTVSSGNDFFHINLEEFNAGNAYNQITLGHLARNLCLRKTGAGADGVVYYTIGEKIVDFEIFNSDGNKAELSGNGMAGLSALLFYMGKFKNQLTLNTSVGLKTHQLLDRDENTFKVRIEIGVPDFRNVDFFPFLKKDKLDYQKKNLTFYPVSVGNPHAVVLLEEEFSDEELETMGKMLESANAFPQKANIELVFFKNDENCRVFYYERGVGRTFSSSTGCAAVFAVLKRLKLINDRLTIDTPGGKIKIYNKGSIYIENFTKIVYKGIYLS